MLHQRAGRRQTSGADSDALDPTTTVYSTSAAGSGSGYNAGGTGQYSYGGYSGGYGSHTPTTPMYGSGSSGPSLFNDKNKKKKSSSFINSILQKLQDPLLILTTVAVICFMFAVKYKLAHQHLHKKVAGGDIHHMSRHREELQRQLETTREAHKKQVQETKKLKMDLVKVKSLANNGKDMEAEEKLTKMTTRENAWKKQYDLLKEAVVKESRRSVIDKYVNSLLI